jgi:hypothetical protein
MYRLIYKKYIIISNEINTDKEIENNYKTNRLIPYEYIKLSKQICLKKALEDAINGYQQSMWTLYE